MSRMAGNFSISVQMVIIRTDSGGFRARASTPGAVLGEFREIEMAMGVDQHVFAASGST